MKTLFLSITLLFAVTAIWAQDNMPYADKAAAIQKDIWGAPTPEFKTIAVPADLKNESAVVLARSFNLQRSSKGKVKLMLFSLAATSHTVKVTTFHERVKLNDKVALEAFSTIEYQKKLDKSMHLMFAKFTKMNNTFIGAKIIKPSGKETIVNTGEEVLLKNETKDQQGKLAIPGLEVGDILDYYISNIDVNETMDGDAFKDNDNLFILADEYPVLFYSIDMQFNKKSVVQVIYANNAPHFEQNTDDDDNQLYSIKLHNLPKYRNQLWTSPLRQYPYIEIGSQYGNRLGSMQPPEDLDMSRFENIKSTFEKFFVQPGGDFDWLEKKVKAHFKSNREYKDASADTLGRLLYNEWRADVFCHYMPDDLQDLGDLNYRTARSAGPAELLAMQLTDMKVDYDIILVASRNSNSLENSFLGDDFSMMIRVNGDTPLYMAFDDVTTQVNEIPARFQGEPAIALTPDRHSSTHWEFSEQNITLPVTASDLNKSEESLQVSLLPNNMQKLKVERNVKETGVSKYTDQRSLIPAQTVDEQLTNQVGGDPLEKRLPKNINGHKFKEEAIPAFQEQVQNMSKAFTAELKNQFDQEPENVSNCKIINPGLVNGSAFNFGESFVLNNMVKKAGDNYIIDAGKLTGGFYKLEDKDRKRDVDVYFPSAHTIKYTIAIAIPQGYVAKGLEEMTVNKSNQTGSFASLATVSGNTLTITVSRVYAHNFEKAATWGQVTELVDAASNFNTQKILLAKK